MILPREHGRCGGPKLHSFIGLSTTLSPKARFNTLLGYTEPFDRHDWVIDFYSGKDNGTGSGKMNFYLDDVRPKLNTWEGHRHSLDIYMLTQGIGYRFLHQSSL